jgi:hypothetical protein
MMGVHPSVTLMDSRGVIDAALAYRAASKALDDFLKSGGRPSWRDETVERDVLKANRLKRLELTDAVSRARIALLDAALA